MDFDQVSYWISKPAPHVVTRHVSAGSKHSYSVVGAYDDPDVAYHAAYASCRAEHEAAGYEMEDERFQYPVRRQGGIDYQNWAA